MLSLLPTDDARNYLRREGYVSTLFRLLAELRKKKQVIILCLWYIQNGAPKLLLMAQPLNTPSPSLGRRNNLPYRFHLS